MDEGVAVFSRQFNGFGCRFIEEVAVKDDIGSIAFGGRNLTQGRMFRHADDRLTAVFTGCQGDALGVVAG